MSQTTTNFDIDESAFPRGRKPSFVVSSKEEFDARMQRALDQVRRGETMPYEEFQKQWEKRLGHAII